MSISESSKGFVAITMAFSLLALCAFVGLAVDLGYFRYIKRDMQNAADAAAIGAAMAIANSESGEALGRADSARNGYTHGADGIVVSVNNPPAGGSFAGNNGYVQAVITQPQPTFFMGVVSFNSVDIAASATAYVQESGSGCIYVLDPTAKLAMTLTGGSTLDVGCDIYVNSDHPNDALNVGSASTINASGISVVGGTDIHPDASVTPDPVTGVTPQVDPLSHIPEPTVGECDYTSEFVVDSGTQVLDPGVYCGGIKVASEGTLAIFNPGEYILMTKGLLVKGGANAQGDGVTFFATYTEEYSFLGYNVTGGSTTVLTAPTSGPRAGMLFMTDRRVYNTKQNHIGGHSNTVIDGTIYMPGTPLVYNGGSTGSGNYTILVSSTLEIGGGSVINSNYGGLPSGESIIRVGVLVE